ncbi:Fic family protein [Candidatus Shapirobacteria bacterium]|nr:Fic family protein [Candidatus Shapirobacteria bacterium]
MNETIKLTPRQRSILSALSEHDRMSRDDISSWIKNSYPVSKATLARDLEDLLIAENIKAEGNGRSRVYLLKTKHPLLKPVDLNLYFELEADERKNINKCFQIMVLESITGLFSDEEKNKLTKEYRSFGEVKKNMDRTILEKELERFVIELAWKSSKIEGNTYTLLETETLIKQNLEAKGRSKQETEMILNHKLAFKLILDNLVDFKKPKLNVLLELHNVLTKNLEITSGIRKSAVGITGTNYRPIDNEWQIREALEKLILAINRSEYPLEKALIANSVVAYLQPFVDGNKRTARMFSNAILMANDYFPLSYRSVDENEYKEAMLLFYETNNLYHVKRLFVEQYRFALKTYFVE